MKRVWYCVLPVEGLVSMLQPFEAKLCTAYADLSTLTVPPRDSLLQLDLMVSRQRLYFSQSTVCEHDRLSHTTGGFISLWEH